MKLVILCVLILGGCKSPGEGSGRKGSLGAIPDGPAVTRPISTPRPSLVEHPRVVEHPSVADEPEEPEEVRFGELSPLRVFAVSIGLDAYGGAARLEHCIADAEAMDAWFARCGVPASQRRLLRNASGAAILDALLWLVLKAKNAGLVIVYWSGHGTQLMDRNGDENEGLDEALVLLDGSTALADDDIDRVLGVLPCRTLVIADACHAGTVTKEFAPRRSHGRLVANSKTLLQAGQRPLPLTPELLRRIKASDRAGVRPIRVALLAASESHQLANVGRYGDRNSPFTAALLKVLGRANRRHGLSFGQLRSQTNAILASRHLPYSQTPTLYALRKEAAVPSFLLPASKRREVGRKSAPEASHK